MTQPQSGPPGSEPWRLDTAPQAAVDLPLSPAAAGRAAGDVSTVLLIRAVVAGLAAVLLLGGAVVLFRHGVRPDLFPPFAGGAGTEVTRYSGPWIGGAAGLALLGVLALTSGGIDLFRWIRFRRSATIPVQPGRSPAGPR